MSADQVIRFRDRHVSVAAGRPLLMGIVNANPDSFSDVRRLTTLDAQVDHAMRLVADGADLIDVGGESGVTYTGVTAEQVEIERVCPLIERLAGEGVIVSVDTWKPAVARAALDAGAAMLNDVSGLREPVFAELCAQTGAALVLMHTRAAPKQVHFADYAGDVAGDVAAFLAEIVDVARGRGVADDQLVLDPGPDFAKTPAETIASLQDIGTLRAMGLPLLLAVSNKYFVGAVTGRPPGERLAGTLAAVGWSADRGAAIVRVHDVAAAHDYLSVRRVLTGEEPLPDFDAQDDALKWIRAQS
ncbi:dihydropteroate synthase [Paraconexibacter sp.]|uniref:dihydropteroate synthase n=1 Tax=Paraconexibacter sp. TaxID=2949640 RepID=UPI00356A5D57